MALRARHLERMDARLRRFVALFAEALWGKEAVVDGWVR